MEGHPRRRSRRRSTAARTSRTSIEADRARSTHDARRRRASSSSRWRSTTSTGSTTRRTRSPPSSRRACCRPRRRRGLGGVLQLHRVPRLRDARSPKTIAKGIVTRRPSTTPGSCRRLVGAIALGPPHVVVGLPTSSSHALIGGLAGAAIASVGLERARCVGGTSKIAIVHRPRRRCSGCCSASRS